MLVRTRGQKAGMLGFTRTGTSIPGFPLLKARQPSHRGGHGLSYRVYLIYGKAMVIRPGGLAFARCHLREDLTRINH
jgi:hypothetical protein